MLMVYDVPRPAPLERLKVGVRCKLNKLLHEAVTVAKRAVMVRRWSSETPLQKAHLCRAAGQIRLRAFLRKG